MLFSIYSFISRIRLCNSASCSETSFNTIEFFCLELGSPDIRSKVAYASFFEKKCPNISKDLRFSKYTRYCQKINPIATATEKANEKLNMISRISIFYIIFVSSNILSMTGIKNTESLKISLSAYFSLTTER